MLRVTVLYALCLCVIVERARSESNQPDNSASQKADQISSIVIPVEAQPAEHHAAADLRSYIEMMTGIKASIVTEGQPRPTGRAIILGRTKDNLTVHNPDNYPWPRDTIYIGYGKGDIAIIGQGEQGTLFAAYEFLRDQGCRWYTPCLDGTVIPRRGQLDLAGNPKRHTPSFRRRGWVPPNAGGTTWKTYYLPWAVRNGLNALNASMVVEYPATLGYGIGDRDGHTLGGLIPSGDTEGAAEAFAAHPEWYPLISTAFGDEYGNKRIWKSIRGAGWMVQACFSNPGTAQEAARKVIKWFNSHPRCSFYCVGVNDNGYFCECEGCKALDGPSSTWKANDIYDSYPQYSKTGPGPMSARFVKFVNRVARIVGEQCPGKYVGLLAYATTVAPPQEEGWTLEPNVAIVYAYGDGLCYRHDETDPTCKQNALMHKWLGEWVKSGNPVYIYDYPPTGHPTYFDVPTGFTHRYKQYVTYMKTMGVQAWCGEGQGTWTSSGLWQYLKARLLWDMDTDVDTLVSEFCRNMYGPAAAEMKAFYDTYDREITDGVEHAVYGGWFGKLEYNTIARLNACLTRAEKKLGNADEVFAGNVAKMRVSMNCLMILLMEANAADAKYAPLFELYDQEQESCLELMNKYDIRVASGMMNRLSHNYRPPFEALSGKPILTLPLIWRFRTDRDDEGITEGWHKAPDSQSSAWTDIRVDASWTNQGFDYHGVAWYAIRFTVPQEYKGRLWLLFEALDGDSEIWIDGKSVGKLPLHPWDKPKGVDVTSVVTPGKESQLVIRVVKGHSAAGIWKIVKLVTTNERK